MNNFTFYAPTLFAFGKDKDKEVAKYIKQFGGTKVLIHYGGGSIKRSGLYDTVVNALNEANIPFVELGGVQPNPRDGLVYEGIKLCRKENVDFILAVGGGSTIDSSKAIAAGVKYDGDFWDFYSGKLVEEALPIGTILTISAAGSEGSSGSVITKEEGMLKRSTSGDVIRPVFSILNPALTCSLSPYQTAAGATDIMIHVMERYFSNTKEVEITDRLCEGVLQTMLKEAPRVIADPNNYEARANIMWAGMIAHNNICGVGRDQDWSSHDIEHELSAFYDVTHGAGLAVIAPAWMKYVMPKNQDKFVQFASRVFGCSIDFEHPEVTAAQGIERFQNFLVSIGMPATLKELGAKEEDIPAMAHHMGITETITVGQFVKLNVKDVEAIYRLAL